MHVSNIRTWIDIDLKALEHNWAELNKLAASNMAHKSGIIPVIKADAYGHGMLEVARVLAGQGCSYFGVSNTEEAVILREAGIKGQILLFESTLAQDAKDIVAYQLTPTVCNLELAHQLSKEASVKGVEVPIHIKIDTGMGRLGVAEGEALDLVKEIRRSCPNLVFEGIYTHFPMADCDRDFTFAQMRRFRDIVYMLENQFITFKYVHAGNSMGLGDYKSELFNLARPGLMLYGLYPTEELKAKIRLKPVMSIRSKVLFVKTIKKGQGVSYGHTFKAKEDSAIAVLPIGYSNGYLRSLSNKAFVLVGGMRCPVLGRVTMDQIMVDVTVLALSGRLPVIGDEAVILGRQKDQEIRAEELARLADTISYEIVCSLGSRLPRHYIH